MAALTIVAALVGASALSTLAADPTPLKQKVNLALRIDGVSAQGGEVIIKPGHPGCRFESITFQTKDRPPGIDNKIHIDAIEVETFSADRDCSFVITLKEKGLPDKTVRRNLQISAPTPGKTAKPESLTCFISSNSLSPPPIAAKPDETKRKK